MTVLPGFPSFFLEAGSFHFTLDNKLVQKQVLRK